MATKIEITEVRGRLDGRSFTLTYKEDGFSFKCGASNLLAGGPVDLAVSRLASELGLFIKRAAQRSKSFGVLAAEWDRDPLNKGGKLGLWDWYGNDRPIYMTISEQDDVVGEFAGSRGAICLMRGCSAAISRRYGNGSWIRHVLMREMKAWARQKRFSALSWVDFISLDQEFWHRREERLRGRYTYRGTAHLAEEAAQHLFWAPAGLYKEAHQVILVGGVFRYEPCETVKVWSRLSSHGGKDPFRSAVGQVA